MVVCSSKNVRVVVPNAVHSSVNGTLFVRAAIGFTHQVEQIVAKLQIQRDRRCCQVVEVVNLTPGQLLRETTTHR